MESLFKALAEQGGAWIAFGFSVLLIAALLRELNKRGDQDRKDRDLMVQVIEANTTFIKSLREVLVDTQSDLKELHVDFERQSRNSEEVAKTIVAISFGLKGVRDAVHMYFRGRFAPPEEDDT